METVKQVSDISNGIGCKGIIAKAVSNCNRTIKEFPSTRNPSTFSSWIASKPVKLHRNLFMYEKR